MEVLIKKVAESVGQPISFTRLKNIVKRVGVPIGTNTVINYLDYAKASQLIVSIENYDAKIARRMTSPKYYFVDNGLLNLFLVDADAALLENLAATHLVRQYGADNVYFYEDNVEVDFYVPESGLAIQACYSMQNDQTSKREIGALIKFADRVNCERLIILTYGEEAVLHEDGHEIAVEPIWKWLLESD